MPIKLFNMDLHISVIADLKYILKDIYGDGILITNWSISGHSWVFGKQPQCPEYVNQYTWKNINLEMIDKFVNKYYDFLSEFDGFIVTHSPVFCLLYEKFNKPIILINSCRYEQPFSWGNVNLEMWNYLNKKLKEIHDKKILIAISNNKGDAEYLKLGTGIESIIIPSLCLYTQSYYTGINNSFIINNNYNNNIPEKSNLFNKERKLRNGYKWQELYNYKGIVHMPYEISTMSIFEQYSANIPLFFPSKEYLKKLLRTGRYHFNSRYTQIRGNNSIYPIQLNDALEDNKWVDFWLDKADYYDEDNMKYIIYFNNNDELFNLLEQTNLSEISNKMKEYNMIRKSFVYSIWTKIMTEYFCSLKILNLLY
jgi:hypothetical protein